MRLFKRKLSILLILVLLVSILLPGVSAFAQSINSVKVNQESVEETVTFNNENQTWKENVQLNGSNSSSIEKVDVEPQNVVLVYATILIQRVGNTFYNAIQRVSATPATQTVYRSFTANNFRYNLIIKTGGDPTTSYEAHHIFPQAFASRFSSVGMNNCDPRYGTWVEKSLHRAMSNVYNSAWSDFFRVHDIHGTTPTLNAILSHGRALSEAYALKTYF